MKKRHHLVVLVIVVAALAVSLADLPAHAGNRALLVGIEDYPNPKAKLRGVRDDVELVKNALTARGVLAPQEMAILLDRQATKANIMNAFYEWLVRGTQRGDTVFFYYSGHGTQLWDEIGDSEDGYAQALHCWDAQFVARKERRVLRGVHGEAWNAKKTRNLLLDHEIHGMLKKLTGRTVIFICDACFSGTVYKNVDPFFEQIKTMDQLEECPSVFEPRLGEEIVLKAKRRTHGITGSTLIPNVHLAAILSSQDSEPSAIARFTQPPTGLHSVMTWYLYNGIMGAAGTKGDGALTLGELGQYIQSQVRQKHKQTPQYVFSPESMASLPIVPKRSGVSPGPSRPSPVSTASRAPVRMGCSVQATGVSPGEVQQLTARLGTAVPWVVWTEDSSKVSCRIVIERRGDVCGARLSDATGSTWETVQGPTLEALVPGLAGNLRAYAIQVNLECLKNSSGRMRFDVDIKVNSSRPRSGRDVAEGDFIAFESVAKTPGYLYIFSVNAAGVIYPLYPTVNGKSELMQPSRPVLLGADNTFQVTGPFGKDMLFAILFEKPPANLGAFWSRTRIGEALSESSQPQQQFLDALWSELTSGGRPKGDWASQMWVIRSFKQ